MKTPYIDPGSPWQNGYVESFHDKFRRERLNREVFHTLGEARVVIEEWRRKFNAVRPHRSLRTLTPQEYARQGSRGEAVAPRYQLRSGLRPALRRYLDERGATGVNCPQTSHLGRAKFWKRGRRAPIHKRDYIDTLTLAWSRDDDFQFILGQQKPGFTYEYDTSSNRILTVERSMLVNQLAPRKSPGLMFEQ